MQKMSEARLNKFEPVTVVCRRSCGIHETSETRRCTAECVEAHRFGESGIGCVHFSCLGYPGLRQCNAHEDWVELCSSQANRSMVANIHVQVGTTDKLIILHKLLFWENKLKTAAKEYSRAKTRAVEHIPYDGYQLEYISAYQKRDESSQVSR